jgi:glycosyltransferase involved in cell wall biosynthesis
MSDQLFVKPGISVLMSVYSKEKPGYLSVALNSLTNQTKAADQVVLVCDGPLTPELDDVIKEYAFILPISLLRLPKNVGLSHALNAGLALCKFEWVARFDSDDVCEPFRFERQMEFISHHPKIDVFGGNILEFSNDPNDPHAVRAVPNAHEKIVSTAKFKNPLNHVTVFFKNSIVSAHGGYPHHFQNEDYALWIELITKGYQFGNMNESLVRVRGGSEMVSRRGGLAYLKAEIKMQSILRESGFISGGNFLFNICTRFVIRLCPHYMRQFMYKYFLRSKPNIEVCIKIQ